MPVNRDAAVDAELLNRIFDPHNCFDEVHRQLAAEVRTLCARIAELEGERVADDFGIRSLTTENGGATLATAPTTEQARELVLAMSLACGRMLDDDQAPNYVEFEVSPANQPGYVVHVRRAAGPSPHTLRREAEARTELAEARIAELEHVAEAQRELDRDCGYGGDR